MADLAASDITVTIVKARRVEGRPHNKCKLAFGDGAKTYPAGGIPINIGAVGCPNIVESLVIYDKGTSGYQWTYDTVNKKLICMQAPAQSHNHALFLKDAAQADGAGNRVNAAASNKLGANTGTSISVVGVADTSGNGGIVTAALAAAGLTEASTIAIAAQTLHCEVIGW